MGAQKPQEELIIAIPYVTARKGEKMNKQDIYTLCTLIPSMDDYSGHNMYLCGKRDGFNECVQMLKDNLKNVKEEAGV